VADKTFTHFYLLQNSAYLLQNSFIHQIKSSATKITSESNIEVLLTLIQSWFFIIKTEKARLLYIFIIIKTTLDISYSLKQ